MCRLLPRSHGLPRFPGGSASASSLSRPAQASRALRPAGLLNRPRRPLSRGSSPVSCPARPLVSYQINRQLSGWNLPPLVIRAVGAHCRVEDGRGGLGHAATLRFPSPLIKPDVRISRIRLSDWFHLAAHGGHQVRCVLPKQWALADAPSSTDRCPSSPRGKASSEAPGYSWVFQAHRQSPILSSVQSAPEARALPSASITRPPRSYGPLRLPSDPPPVRRVGCQPQSRRVSPDDPHHPS